MTTTGPSAAESIHARGVWKFGRIEERWTPPQVPRPEVRTAEERA
ncbi:hypothetical protein [Actinacidiphila paucisporea]|nr:hypothetical protein [Actinacidiphila paucisporea]